MVTITKLGKLAVVVSMSVTSLPGFAQSQTTNAHVLQTPVEKRELKEKKIPPNYFAITFYEPTYVLPYYYTASPYNVVYSNSTPNNEKLKSSELKYQLSLKMPLWKNMFDYPSTLYFAYTQLSYWQLYNRKEFFRETDYKPEFFISNEIHYPIPNSCWKVDAINFGVNHESNGFGNQLERSWNRLYVDLVAANSDWMISLRPWYVLSTHTNNRNIASYLGHGRVLVAYKQNGHVLSLQARNFLEAGGKRTTAEFTWSVPITPYLKAYAQIFSGYGQSLIEYNHRTNGVGVGIAFSDWI